jgi:hypothetical protein
MLKALIWKELRELLPLIAAILLLQAFLICVGLGIHMGFMSNTIRDYIRGMNTIPFINDQLCFWMTFVGGVGAVTAGLWQTIWESGRGTFQFLLHRPVNRSTLIGCKLLAGGAASLLMISLPFLYYSIWSAVPGTHASPFFWSMTTDYWQICLLVPLIYLGAFASGLQNARWYGSRFLPLFASLLTGSLLISMSTALASPFYPVAGLLVPVLSVLAEIGFVIAALNIAAATDFS